MKTTIKIVLIAICLFTIQLNVTAQKVMKVRRAPSDVSTTVTQPIKQSVIDLMVKLPKQDKTLGMATGMIYVTADSLLEFDEKKETAHRIALSNVKENIQEPSSPGGLLPYKFSFAFGYLDSGTPSENNTPLKIIYTKINDRQYKYDIYNIPLNKMFAIVFAPNASCMGGCPPDPMTNMSLTNAFRNAGITSPTNVISADPNYQAVQANYAFQLLPITISNPPRVN